MKCSHKQNNDGLFLPLRLAVGPWYRFASVARCPQRGVSGEALREGFGFFVRYLGLVVAVLPYLGFLCCCFVVPWFSELVFLPDESGVLPVPFGKDPGVL